METSRGDAAAATWIFRGDKSRRYRVVRLANGITVALVRDEATDKAAAALCAGIGAYSDTDAAGLAHFLEHMLFQGTKTYPEDNAYKQHRGRAEIMLAFLSSRDLQESVETVLVRPRSGRRPQVRGAPRRLHKRVDERRADDVPIRRRRRGVRGRVGSVRPLFRGAATIGDVRRARDARRRRGAF